MRLARKLFLLTAMALAAMALAASSASAAETPVEVMPEPGTGHCNPCYVHAVGAVTSEFRSHIFGSESGIIFTCTDELKGEIHEDGSGHFTSYENDHGTAPLCIRFNCADTESEWPIERSGETGPNRGHLIVHFCLTEENGGEQHCSGIELNIETDELNHVTHISASEARGTVIPGIGFCEVTGLWEIETGIHEGLEIEHL